MFTSLLTFAFSINIGYSLNYIEYRTDYREREKYIYFVCLKVLVIAFSRFAALVESVKKLL